MKKITILLSIFLTVASCNDGDFDVPSFVFEGKTINTCNDNLILFKINENEALILDTGINNTDDVFFTTARENEVFDLTNKISYRIFNEVVSTSYFCQDIPPTEPVVTNKWNGSGTLIVTNTITFNDNDGVEELDLLTDTDLDLIPNYYDFDDDNDGVKTINELNFDGNEIDTDGDNIPNHLDNDDDNDTILTINELRIDSNSNGSLDYLDDTTVDVQPEFDQLDNIYTLSYITSFTIENMSLTNDNNNSINYDTYDYEIKFGDIIVN